MSVRTATPSQRASAKRARPPDDAAPAKRARPPDDAAPSGFGSAHLRHANIWEDPWSPCGDARVSLEFAGWAWHFRGLGTEQRDALAQRFGAVEGSSRSVPQIDVVALPSQVFYQRNTAGWELEVSLAAEANRVFAASWGFAGTFSVPVHRVSVPGVAGNETPARLYVDENAPERFLGFAENFLRMLTAYRALEAGQVLLHSATVVRDGVAYVFVGPSGAGKTTLCQISHSMGAQVLSDELNILAPGDGGRHLIVRQVPFAGDFGNIETTHQATYPCGGIFRLFHAPKPHVERLRPSVAVSTLVAACPFVNSDTWRMAQLLDTMESLVRRQPVHALHFARDASFWPVVLGADGAAA